MLHRILAPAAIVLLSACGDAPRDCTLAALDSSVFVDAHSSVSIVRLCVDDRCDTSNQAFLENEPRTYTYELTILIGGTEETLVGEVETREIEVNGPGCGTTAYAILRVRPNGSVIVDYPSSDR